MKNEHENHNHTANNMKHDKHPDETEQHAHSHSGKEHHH
jgi:hypothetical protein